LEEYTSSSGVVSRILCNYITLDEHYVPYLGARRLRSSGSASDHCRVIVAYVLALAEASAEKSGLHPGFTLLDEPFQQNPDDPHRDLFVSFPRQHIG
jgi:hypothetical protein